LPEEPEEEKKSEPPAIQGAIRNEIGGKKTLILSQSVRERTASKDY